MRPRIVTVSFALAGLLALVSCAPPAPSEPVAEALPDLPPVSSWTDAFNAGDAAGLAALYSEDAILMPPNAEALSGREAIQTFWEGFMAEGGQVSLGELESTIDGHHGYQYGTYQVVDGEGNEVDRGKWIVIFQHGPSGWQMHRDIWNSDLPLPG